MTHSLVDVSSLTKNLSLRHLLYYDIFFHHLSICKAIHSARQSNVLFLSLSLLHQLSVPRLLLHPLSLSFPLLSQLLVSTCLAKSPREWVICGERVHSKKSKGRRRKIDSLTNRCPITSTRITRKKVVFTIFFYPISFCIQIWCSLLYSASSSSSFFVAFFFPCCHQ